MRRMFLALVLSALLVQPVARAEDGPAPASPSASARPIQALLVTGGCCHDYERQKRILTRGISARANVQWTVVHQGGTTTDTPIPLYNDPQWADGFDIVVHNECFSGVTDPQFVDRILKPHREGTPAILIHCAMHCYRVGDNSWFDFVGLQSPGHGPHYAYKVENLQPDHPIMTGLGNDFVAPKGELYHTTKIFDSATPLAQAKRQSDGAPQVCVWTNDYHGTRVFGTTIGHYNETMVEPKYLDMLARGLLWAVGRDPAEHFTPSDEETNTAIKELANAPLQPSGGNLLPQNCCGDGNLAYQKPVTAKSVQEGNDAKHLTDGLLNTRWCASGSQNNEWVVVDLGEAQTVRTLRLHWEKREGVAYRYTVEGSADNQQWKVLVDASENQEPGGIRAHSIDAADTRYLRVTFLGAKPGVWGSLWELEASSDELPELAEMAIPEGEGGAASLADVQSPPGFNVTLFGQPPEVNYPVCLTTASTGEVFVGVDEQGSLGKQSGAGKVLRCIDTDGDGVADRINDFAKMDHPRGLVYDNGSLWVLHPPYLSVFRDTDGDGTSDESELLIDGISTEEVNRRGADHTTNGIRLGIDGWIYIAVGDFGFTNAVAKDGTALSRRGGGIVRIRPDGSDMEIFAWGLRNILDVSIDPYMNIFTRDNTNDGGGWDIRVSHILQSADYGYPSLYMNFSDEAMPALADYGGGSGCGTMYFQDRRWPEGFNDLLLTCDWGRSVVYSHNLPANGATFDAQQDTFLTLPRPTDIDVDASGRMYVSSWKNGGFSFTNPNVGFVAQVTPVDFVPHPVPEVQTLDEQSLMADLANHPSAAWRLTVQRELLRRAAGDPQAIIDSLAAVAGKPSAPLYGRVAAVFTLGQIAGPEALQAVYELSTIDELREFTIRAMTDDATIAKEAPRDLLVAALSDANPRVQAAALIGLGRVFDATAGDEIERSAQERDAVAQAILPLSVLTETSETTATGDDWRQPHPQRVLPHLAVKALAQMQAIHPCLDALGGPYQSGALWALKSMHAPETVDGLFATLGTVRDEALRREIWTTLIRLYHREGPFEKGWWGTRPDTTGPYYDRQEWSQSPRIADAIAVAFAEADASLAAHLDAQLKRHVVELGDRSSADAAKMQANEQAIELPKVDPQNPNQIANLSYGEVSSRALQAQGDADVGQVLFRSQACINCHSFANGQLPKGPHLVDIGKRYKQEELIESIVDPSKKIAQGFDTWGFLMVDGSVHTGFVVQESAQTVTIRQNNGLSMELPQDDIEERIKREDSMMPKGVIDNLTPEQLADLIAYLESLH